MRAVTDNAGNTTYESPRQIAEREERERAEHATIAERERIAARERRERSEREARERDERNRVQEQEAKERYVRERPAREAHADQRRTARESVEIPRLKEHYISRSTFFNASSSIFGVFANNDRKTILQRLDKRAWKNPGGASEETLKYFGIK